MGRRTVYLIAVAILLISVAIIRADLPVWDSNGDGVIDFSDLVLAARHFGETGVGVTGDVNADGTVNILDLVLICCHFGEGSDEGEDEAVTVVELTDTVLVADTMRFGVNLGPDNYWGSTFVKKRTQVNFEGTSYRQCHYGPTPQDEYGATSWFREPDWWQDLMREHGYYTILSGPAKGTTGKIAGISTRMHEHHGVMKEFMYIEFDRTVEPGPPNGGLLVEAFRLEDGQFRSGNLGIFWTFLNSELAIGDVPPGSFGHAALCMKGTTDPAYVNFSTHYQRYGETNGTWYIRFWAKAKSGTPTLTLIARGYPPRQSNQQVVKPAPEWTEFEETIVVSGVSEPVSGVSEPADGDDPHLFFKFEVDNGDVLVDDIDIWMEGDTNPTVFRDDLVETLRELNPGILRSLRMGGSTIDNTIAPLLKSHSYSSRKRETYGPYEEHETDSYSLHEMYELCEYVGCDPWYCLPGTLHQDELANFIEYLGAPADVGYGRKRAEMGQMQPWTEVFENIHIEFGNEAWNNAWWYQCGGYKGPDYWKDLIETGKNSPYYTPNILFHAGGQAVNNWLNPQILADVPNADRFSVAPYIIGELENRDLDILDTDEKLFHWVFARPIWRSRDPRGHMYKNHQSARDANIELSVYEVNHGVTGGDAPLEPRNRIVTSIGGGLNVANTMLLMLKEHGVRIQCFFTLTGHSYKAAAGEVRLWGAAINMRDGYRRYRPTFLACSMANEVLSGDLVATVHSGFDPTFDATGRLDRERDNIETMSDIPSIWSYGFVDDDDRGLILINLDVSEPHMVEIRFQGSVADGEAKSWILSADSITDNNEFEVGEPQVVVSEETLAKFANGTRVVLPAHSMRVIKWEIQTAGNL